MTYRIRVIDGEWRLLRRGAIIGTYGTRIEARIAMRSERVISGDIYTSPRSAARSGSKPWEDLHG